MQAEQQRIERDTADAQHWRDAADRQVERVMERLEQALGLTGSHDRAYATAEPHERRLLNASILEHVLVHDDPDTGYAELTAAQPEDEPARPARTSHDDPRRKPRYGRQRRVRRRYGRRLDHPGQLADNDKPRRWLHRPRFE